MCGHELVGQWEGVETVQVMLQCNIIGSKSMQIICLLLISMEGDSESDTFASLSLKDAQMFVYVRVRYVEFSKLSNSVELIIGGKYFKNYVC